MKTLSISRNVTIISIIMLIASCSKESIQPAGSTTSIESPQQSSLVTLNLVANAWIDNQNGIYTNTFTDVLKSFNSSSAPVRNVSAFVVLQYYSLDIIKNPLTYQGGILEATVSNNDVIVNYYSSKPLPFSSLQIKLVIVRN